MIQFVLLLIFCSVSTVVSKCPNSCSGHGLCGTSNLCTCFDGWTGGAPDCSFRNCPNGTAWADKAYSTDAAHQITECSNAGICDRSSGTCQCFSGFTGSACQRSKCPNDCSGHGTCATIKDVALFDGPDYDSAVTFSGDGLGMVYDNWDKNSIQLCECDNGFFSSDCSQLMCPKGDDPLTINQNYRSVLMSIGTGSPYELSGRLGLTFMGETVFLSLTYPSSDECTNAIAFHGKFGNVLCTFTRVNDYSFTMELVFYSWPTHPKENNLYTHDGNPSRFDFYCDSSFASPLVFCTFEDKQATNIREYAYCSNRGKCDFVTGTCSCISGFGGPACSNATYLYTEGSNALPGLQVNVNGLDYQSSALLLQSEKSKASDFQFIKAMAGTETVFYVQGDGTVGINKLKTLTGGQTVSGSGLFIESGGCTISGDALNVVSPITTDPVVSISNQYASALGSAYTALKVSTAGSDPNTHYLIKGYSRGAATFLVRGDGALFVRGGGVAVTAGVTVNSGGLKVTGGVTVNSGGLNVATVGLGVTGGVTIYNNGIKVTGGLQVFGGGASVYSGGMKVFGGVSIGSGGFFVTGATSIGTGGLAVTGGLTINDQGVYIATKGLTVANGGLVVTTKGLTVSNDGLTVTAKGLTVLDGGLTVTTKGMTIGGNGLTVVGGLTVSTGGGNFLLDGLSVQAGGMVVTGGLSVATLGLSVTGGVTIGTLGLNVNGPLAVTGQVSAAGGIIVTGGLTVGTDGLAVDMGGLSVNGGTVRITDNIVVVGSGEIRSGLLVSGGITVFGDTRIQSSEVVFSDRRLKTNLMPIRNALQKVSKLQGVYFNWVQDEPSGLTFDTNRHVGVIAQDVMAVLPEAVEQKHSGMYLGVDYAAMVPLLIEAMHDLDDLLSHQQKTLPASTVEHQGLADEIASLRTAVATVQDENAALRAEVTAIKALLSSKGTESANLRSAASTTNNQYLWRLLASLFGEQAR